MRLKPLKSQQFDSLGARNMRVMKVVCPECNSKAIIRKTVRKHRHISDIYCACADVECGHTFVLNMTFSHTLSPSAKSQDSLLKGIVDTLNPEKRQMLLSLLQSPAA
ncbi:MULTISPECIES: ogr/Delta-like zinc finger family protein [Pectobacterium]|uniref:Transcriptional regulator n=3 Tax=Pectobacterium TaxID=122277 RepID=A0A8B3G1K8_PECPM|nr:MULTISPECIES: ogr/Delta-like zinc finger family protein [Pectobacterium]MDC9820929.1 ogr/Delta-like zinc finger family protein [Pectobacterium polonicum]MDY4383897.1 ogr/Delta-like zinc finger family protein [Pectobacterium brasiliense]RKO77203.1 transcriptional regulator [Pectobacterium parmentieri]WKA63679.1 ogr/Delta-like zinc finger family protein [Pectobacterium aroidearum]